MNDRDKQILEHMLDDARDIVEIVALVGSLESFISNNLMRKAAVMSMLNIGELANKLSIEYRESVVGYGML